MRTPILLLAVLVAACTRTAAEIDVAAAVDRTLAAGSGVVELTYTFDPPDGPPVVAHGDGGFDLRRRRRWLRVDLAPLVAAAGGPGRELARATTVVDGDHVYVLRPDGRWVHVQARGAASTEPFASAGPEALLAAARDGAGADVALDRRGRVRRIEWRTAVGAGTVAVTVEVRSLGASVEVPLPPPDAVVHAPS